MSILEHERYHVARHFYPAFLDYKAAARALGADCMKRRRAVCIRAVVLDELKEEFKARSNRDAALWDWQVKGGTEDEEQTDAGARVESTAIAYAAARAATAKAVAACPAGSQSPLLNKAERANITTTP